jgi:FkbM family methyltransferase
MPIVRFLKDLRYRLFYALFLRAARGTVTLGGSSHWTICPDFLTGDSVVYSAGVGHDVSFEKALAERFGCTVHLFDPSPTGAGTMSKVENRHARLIYRQCGLAEFDRSLSFSPPASQGEGSWSMTVAEGTEGVATFECLSLPTLMQQLGRAHIDLLKMDIEGFEYGVLAQICSKRIRVKQICVEFHHANLPGIARAQTIKSILALHRAGYRLIHRENWDHTFVLASALPQRIT